MRAALRVLGLPDDAAAASVAISHTGDARALRPAVSDVQTALTSFKLTVTLPSADASAARDPGDFIRYMWLRNSATGGLVTVREFKPASKGSVAEAPRLAASVPKGLGIERVTPCVYCELHGIWSGDEVSL